MTSEQQSQVTPEDIDALRAQLQEQDIFLRSALHNVKNSLTLTVGYVQYLRKNYSDVLDETACDFLDEVDKSGFKMSDTLDAVSLLINVRSSKLTIKPLDMNVLLQTTYSRLNKLLAESKAVISRPPAWPLVLGDAYYVEQVWYNFLSNAIQYSEQPPQITLSASPIETNMVRFSVQDSGPGLSPENQLLMFTPFPRVSKNRTDSVGLGLYVSRKIIEELGGQVSIESEPGHGSTFSFTLPIAP